MTLIKSISGIRGTIGGNVGENLTPLDAVKFAAAFGTFLKQNSNKDKLTVVIGRDARISGPMIHTLVMQTLVGLGINCIDLGLSTTPTVEIAVPMENADGGIILTASHNPKQWNALKLLNEKGEFLNGEDGEVILKTAESDDFYFAEVDDLGTYSKDQSYLEKHINEVLNLELVDVEAIKKANFKEILSGLIELVSSTENLAEIKPALEVLVQKNEWSFGKVMGLFRLSLVGDLSGPDLFQIASLIGKDTCVIRMTLLNKALEG